MTLPAYGTIALFGIVIVTILGIITAWRRKLSVEAFIKLEFVGGVTAIIGAKLWDMITRFFTEEGYHISLESFTNSGLSFYGGLLFGTCCVFVAALILQVDFNLYAENLIFLVPLLHGIWKTGCFMGGCCYGISYSGPGSVTYPEGVKAPVGTELFPIQLTEAGISFIMAVIFFVRGKKRQCKYPVLEYIGCYSAIRFLTEFLRWHEGKYIISVAQMVSLICVIIVILCYFLKEKKTAKRDKNEQ